MRITTFQYKPLSLTKNDFRLFLLEKGNNAQGAIQGRIVHESLANPPPYTALSYCWGNLHDQIYIEVDGHPFSIRQNLYGALTQLRSIGLSTLWIDALCINQEDIEERSHQVTRMAAIYRRAEQTVAWIGTENITFTATMRELDCVAAKDTSFPTRLRLGPSQIPFPNGIREILQQPYWERMWILQELAFSRQIIILCGAMKINWEHFVRAVLTQSTAFDPIESLQNDENLPWFFISRGRPFDVLAKLFLTAKQPGSSHAFGDSNAPIESRLGTHVDLVKRFHGIQHFRKDIVQNNPISLLEALYRSRTSQASDRKDKVFALLNLAFDAIHHLPYPNYAQDTQALNLEMTVATLAQPKGLEIAVHLANIADLSQQPTWLIDWFSIETDRSDYQMNYLLGRTRFMTSAFWRYRRGESNRGRTRWAADARATATISVDPSSHTIVGRGILIDFVRSLTTTYDCVSDESAQRQDQRAIKADAIPSKPFKAPNGSVQIELLYVLVFLHGIHSARLNQIVEKGTPEEYSYVDLVPWMHHAFLRHSKRPYHAEWVWNCFRGIKRWLETNSSFQYKGHRLIDYLYSNASLAERSLLWILSRIDAKPKQDIEQCDMVDVEATCFLADLEHTLKDNRRLMVTQKDRIGWAHRRAQPGDEIWIMKGCSVPVILRRRPGGVGGWWLVGDAFVSGCMTGEDVKGVGSDA